MNVAKRGRPKKIQTENDAPKVENPIKFERRYEDEETIEIWKFDLNKKPSGPIEVNITYKNGADKKWDKKQKQAKEDRRMERQMKKIIDRDKPKTTGKRGRPKKQ